MTPNVKAKIIIAKQTKYSTYNDVNSSVCD